MIGKRVLTVLALGCAALVGACGSGGEGRENLVLTTGAQLLGELRAQRGRPEKPPVVQVTAQQLANTKVPALQVNPERRGGSEFLRLLARRDDDGPGTVAVWRASDNTQVVLRNGVLVGTRGIGGDIISAEADGTIAAVTGAREGGGARRYFLSDGGYADKELVMSCDIRPLGSEVTQIANLRFDTVHLRERCIGGPDDAITIVNHYWVQPGSGIVRRSQQWAGPYSGQFEFLLLKN